MHKPGAYSLALQERVGVRGQCIKKNKKADK